MAAPQQARSRHHVAQTLAAVALALAAAGVAAQTGPSAPTPALDLRLDVRPFLPAPEAEAGPVGASRPFSPPSLATGAVAPPARPSPATGAALSPAPTSDRYRLPEPGADDGLKLRFNVKGYSLLEMNEADTRFSVRRIRERELRRPAVSFTLQKRF